MTPAKLRFLVILAAAIGIVIVINVRARHNIKDWCLEAYAAAHSAADSARVDSEPYWTGIQRHPDRVTCRELVRPV